MMVTEKAPDNCQTSLQNSVKIGNGKTPESIPGITIYATGGISTCAYIFDHDDAFQTRQHHRIQGDFVGSLPKHISQNQYLSLPLVLSYDEAQFGLSRGFFRLAKDAVEDYDVADEHTVQRFFEQRRSEVEEQVEANVRAQEAERERRTKGVKRPREQGEEDDLNDEIDEVVAPPPPKVQRLGLFGRVGRTIRSAIAVFVPQLGVAGVGEHARQEEEEKEKQKQKEKEKNIRLARDEEKKRKTLEMRLRQQARQTALVVTATAYREDERDAKAVESKLRKPQGVSEEMLKLRGRVFAALHDRGYYLSCGAKFGADFLAYAGNPVLFHAALAVVVVDAAEEVSALDIVALGRLGDSTKKRMVLAYEEGGEVQFFGVQWEETLP